MRESRTFRHGGVGGGVIRTIGQKKAMTTLIFSVVLKLFTEAFNVFLLKNYTYPRFLRRSIILRRGGGGGVTNFFQGGPIAYSL